MATVQTGRSLTVSIGATDYSAQVAEVSLVPNETVEQYITLTDTTAVKQPTTFQLQLRAFQDWGETGSFCDAMWTAAATGSAIAFQLGVAGSGTFSGNIIPAYPTAGGPADSALEVEFTFEVSGDITKA